MSSNYTAEDLSVLEGLDAVRVRPGMYIGNTDAKGMHHILWEIVDNGIDEVANNFGDRIDIEIYTDNSISVTDNGRGIPVDMNKKTGLTGIELVFTRLHAGAKFKNEKYSFSGGLHGVGASVTNALSRWLDVSVYRDGKEYKMSFHSPLVDGKQLSGVKKGELTIEKCDKKLKGTKVHFLPDDLVFKKEKFNFEVINKRIKELAFLNNNLTISLTDNRERYEDGVAKNVTYHYHGGLKDFVEYVNESKNTLYDTPLYFERITPDFRLYVAMQHTDGYNEATYSFVNNIPTADGGTHETGFKVAMTKVLNEFARTRGILKEKQENFMGEDLREGLTCVIAISLRDAQFEGQTKGRLTNTNARQLCEQYTAEGLTEVLNKLPNTVIDKIFGKANQAMKVRKSMRSNKELARKLNKMTSSALVGKLSPCIGKKTSENELFIVEGDSAGGSAKQGRDRNYQAILPLKGKPLNAEKKRIEQILDNEEIHTIVNALGAGIDETFDVSQIKYDKVIILADADQDGAHIRAILLTFFFRYMKSLLSEGHVYIGTPPLYKVESKIGGIQYAYDDKELDEILAKVGTKKTLQRYKGLGEMNPEQLWETTMDPARRVLMRVTLEDGAQAEAIVATLMGDNVEARKEYIYKHANFNKTDIYEKINN